MANNGCLPVISALLCSTSADYVLNSGTIDTAGLSPGHYVLTLTPQWARVLRDELNFEQDIEQSFMRPAHSIGDPVAVEFDIE